MSSVSKVYQFRTGRLNGGTLESGYQTLAENIDEFLQLPTTNVWVQDFWIESRFSQRSGLDDLTAYLLVLENDTDPQALGGTPLDRPSWRAVANLTNEVYTAWFGAFTDASPDSPSFLRSVQTRRDQDALTLREAILVYAEANENPQGLGAPDKGYVAVPLAPIPVYDPGNLAACSGDAEIYSSGSTLLGVFQVINMSPGTVWAADEPGYVTADWQNIATGQQLIGLPSCAS